MPIELAWYMSCDGDSSHIGQRFADHPPGYETFTRIARNAERAGATSRSSWPRWRCQGRCSKESWG